VRRLGEESKRSIAVPRSVDALAQRKRRPQGQPAEHDQHQDGRRRHNLKSPTNLRFGARSDIDRAQGAAEPCGTTYSIRSGTADSR
jgi:hypothetical protein